MLKDYVHAAIRIAATTPVPVTRIDFYLDDNVHVPVFRRASFSLDRCNAKLHPPLANRVLGYMGMNASVRIGS